MDPGLLPIKMWENFTGYSLWKVLDGVSLRQTLWKAMVVTSQLVRLTALGGQLELLLPGTNFRGNGIVYLQNVV